jgi:hypothetical protein
LGAADQHQDHHHHHQQQQQQQQQEKQHHQQQQLRSHAKGVSVQEDLQGKWRGICISV